MRTEDSLRLKIVMAGLDPAIHMPETGSVGAEKGVDGRIKSGHDG
jgi:hypothetical protein